MKRISLLFVGLLCISVMVHAGEVITNDTGEDATGLRVTFSTPVLITAFGDILTSVDSQTLSFEFTFSGGTVTPWESHWFNYAPTTASVIETEWLNQEPTPTRAIPADDVAVVDHWRTDVFDLVLPEEAGGEVVGTITRTLSVEQIPFVAEYEIDLLVEQANVTWTSIQPDIDDEPDTRTGSAARFLYLSNRANPEVSACFEIDGQDYQWVDPDVSFPLHSLTEISLDASAFYSNEDVMSTVWTATNGDPADAVTFPITDPAAIATTLVSHWPNVLTIQCNITNQDGSTAREAIEALVYFRDGTPFETRGIAATIFGVYTPEQLTEILDRMFPLLADLGVNSVVTAINWWFGPPDEQGNWIIHPIDWLDDPRGGTSTTENLGLFMSRAKELGFQTHVQVLQYPYRNDPQLHEDIWYKYYPFRSSDRFLYGDGENGYLSQLQYYLPFFIEHGVDTVFLNAECGEFENLGGEKTRQFFRDTIAEYRNAGYTGALSYASNLGSDFPTPPPLANLDSANCGIPWADMDYVGLTYYPQLATTNDASTAEMLESARRLVDEFIRPLSETYDKPVFVEDFYCIAWDGCAADPLQNDSPFQKNHSSDLELDLEEARRYHTAVLRSFAETNIGVETPLIAGMTLGVHGMVPEYWLDGHISNNPGAPNVQYGDASRDLQLLMKVFYSDKPLLASGEDGTTDRLSVINIKDSTPAATGWADYQPGSYVELGISLHGIQELDAHICSVDWRDGSVYSFDPSQASSELLGTLPTCITDFEIESDLLWIASNTLVRGYSLSDLNQVQSEIPIPDLVNLDGIAIFGIEKADGLVYLLTGPQGEQRLVVFDAETAEVMYDCPVTESVSEAVGLELFEERLYTFDWSRGRILELHTSDGVVEVIDTLDILALIPSSDRASGGFRGFHMGNEGIYITSIGSGENEKSRIHFLTYPPVE